MVDGKRFFLVGIGGSGMMPLAMILRGRGAVVEGSDRGLDQGRVPAKFAALAAAGIRLWPQDGSGVTSADQTVVASAAVEAGVPDIVAADRIGAPRRTRAQLNAELFNAAPLSIGVAGTSGKSTVTGMIAWILHAAGRDPTAMNGAVMTNFASADAPFASALVGHGDAFVSEVDESDGSIALYRPQIAVLNNVGLDHKSLAELQDLFTGFAGRAGTAIVNLADAEVARIAADLPRDRVVTVAVGMPADLTARDLVAEALAVRFTLVAGDDRIPVHLAVPGAHNVANALVALATVRAAGVPLDEAAGHIAGFTGLRRRFERVGVAGGITVIDDFAHNPDKIAATLATLRAHPGRLLVLFQPHGFGPLAHMRDELVAAFADGMADGDVLILPDPVYQGGSVTRQVTSLDIVADCRTRGVAAFHYPDRADAASDFVARARHGDRIVVMGARDDSLSIVAQGIVASLAERST